MTDLNLETVDPHDPYDCDAGLKRLRDERDLARRVAVSLEQEVAHLDDQLAQARNVNVALVAKLTAHGIAIPDDDEIQGAAV